MKTNLSRWSLLVLTAVFVLSTAFLPLASSISARSLSDIEQEIAQKNSEFQKLQASLKQAEDQFKQAKSQEGQVQSEMQKLENEIKLLESEINVRNLRLQQLGEEKVLRELEKEQNGRLQDLQVDSAYVSWKSATALNGFFGKGDIVKSALYNETLYTKTYGGILGLAQELEELDDSLAGFSQEREELQVSLEQLAAKKKDVEQKLAQAQKTTLAASGGLGQMRGQSSALQQQISQLQKEQQDVQKAESEVIKNNPGGANQELIAGRMYFSGTGRDLYQGHGVGMSQFGALGAALAGWDYKKIVEFYFPGTKVEKRDNLPSSINVNGNNSVATEDYVAGLGEVPDRACEDIGVAFNPGNVWNCWPREAIKAQLVVARTFGARRSGFVYGDTRGQVYKGGQAKAWGASATAGQIVASGSGLADVYYSSDNNQGYGTASSDTVWSNYSGVGTVIPHLKSVNDNAFAFKTSWTSWGWRSNSYTPAMFADFLNWVSTSEKVSSGARSFMNSVRSQIGSLQSFTFERDPSNRVKKVLFKGDKGSKYVAGWMFKSMWNTWVGTVKPTGDADYIYSLTFFMKQS